MLDRLLKRKKETSIIKHNLIPAAAGGLALSGAPRLGIDKTRATTGEAIDQTMLWATLALLLTGLIMVYSATVALPDSNKYASYAPTHFLVRHAMGLFVAAVAAFLVFQVPSKTLQEYAPALFVICLFLLVLVLVPGIGKDVNGSRRWLALPFFNIQPSELMKVAAILYAADYTVRKQHLMHRFGKVLLPMIIVMFAVGTLLLLEPDLGAFMVIVVVVFAILFLGGINAVVFGGVIGLLTAAFALLILFSDYRRARLLAYLDPWAGDNAQNKAYQLSHSLIAFGRGEFFGVGLGGSMEKLHYLPESHTDFLMAIVGEELGFVGVTVVILLFATIVRRCFVIGQQAETLERVFAGLVAKGVGVWLGVQCFINMGVNLGLLPTKGLTLPLMSYGGSAILANCMALALVLRIDYENRTMMRGGGI